MRKQFYILVFLIALFSTAKAQQFPIYSQYWTNKFLLNPAVAGHEGYTSFNLSARKQWVHLEGAPSTLAVSGQTRLVRSSHISRGRNVRKRRKSMSRGGKVGVGGYIFTDDLGVFNRTGFQGTYSYHLSLSRSQLSLGASLIGMQYRISKDEITTGEDDILINSTTDNGYVFDGNFGAYYSDRNLYGGFSVQNIFQSYLKLNNRDGSKIKLLRQYLLIGGYRYDMNDEFYIEPAFNIKFSESLVSQLDLNLTTYIQEDYWAGLGYRTGSSSRVSTETLKGRGSSVIIYGGVKIDKYFFGYSFDHSFSSITSFTYGSHEIMMAVKLGDNARRYRWLNRY